MIAYEIRVLAERVILLLVSPSHICSPSCGFWYFCSKVLKLSVGCLIFLRVDFARRTENCPPMGSCRRN